MSKICTGRCCTNLEIRLAKVPSQPPATHTVSVQSWPLLLHFLNVMGMADASP